MDNAILLMKFAPVLKKSLVAVLADAPEAPQLSEDLFCIFCPYFPWISGKLVAFSKVAVEE